MEIKIIANYEKLSQLASSVILKEIKDKRNLLLCASTGDTPTRTYELLVEDYTCNPELFSQFRIIKLDEWGGIPMDDPQTCESYLQKHLIRPLKIPGSSYYSFLSNSDDPKEECIRIQETLSEQAPIDLCILGLGMNGHVAFNEPSDNLEPYCHIANLTKKSMEHPMTAGMGIKPTYGLTIGMADILQSRKIIILINGSQKKAITKEFLSEKISTRIPASLLWLHQNATCLLCKDVIS